MMRKFYSHAAITIANKQWRVSLNQGSLHWGTCSRKFIGTQEENIRHST